MQAEKLRLDKKGRLNVGSDADIVIFDLEKISDEATFDNPAAAPCGIEYVIIAGEVAARGQEIVDETLGGQSENFKAKKAYEVALKPKILRRRKRNGIWFFICYSAVCTILLAVLTKNVFLALMIGVVLGYLILDGGNVIAALSDSLNGVVNVFTSTGNTIVLMSILLIGAIIYIIEKSGGITGFVDVMIKKRAIIKSKKAPTSLLGSWAYLSSHRDP